MIEEKTREEMISKNLPLVHSCARKFKDRGVEYDDLFQSGCIGLIKAV
ncbi:MAG: flagellar biosynthesis protein FliA, partial [Clostridia bacterium]|nr:flagellar biosynthesis protein FliA [Clostridia bacterium]